MSSGIEQDKNKGQGDPVEVVEVSSSTSGHTVTSDTFEDVQAEPEQAALFEIEGPDEDSCVWLTGEGGVHVNLGSRDAVAEKLCQWLSAIDYGECR